jgi:hypothetical protein
MLYSLAMRRWGACFAVVLAMGCDSGGGMTQPTIDAGPPSGSCGSVRLTSYTAGPSGWCEVDRTLPVMPAFVRSGMTAAIGEPWNGGAYRGDPGEACGECWEIDTINGSAVVMITDLCPIEGNPLCAGAHFHIDLATEAASVLGAGGLDEGSARRVPCPVEGNVHVLVSDANPTYLRFAMLSHRIPIRRVSVRGAGDGVAADNPWVDATRSGGAWEVRDAGELANGGSGVAFRIESAQGQTLESSVTVPLSQGAIDLGVQLDDVMPAPGGACVYEPPALIYGDEWGGIDQVRWGLNAWGEAEAGFHGEVADGCYDGSASCVRVDQLAQWSGFHLYYRQPFPASIFARLSLRARTAAGEGMITVSPGNEGARCEGTTVAVSSEAFTEVTIQLSDVCAGIEDLSLVTVENPGPSIALVIDEVRFSH